MALISIIIPIFVMKKTRKNDIIEFEKKIAIETNRFKTQLNTELNNHNEIIKEQRNILRIGIMLYMVLQKGKIRFIEKDEIVVIDLVFVNKGRGTAVDIWNEYIKDKECSNSVMIAKTLQYQYFCYTPFDWNNNVAMTNEIVSMKIYFNKEELLIGEKEDFRNDQFKFSILYKDVELREYSQEFMLQYEFDNGRFVPLYVNSYSPILLNDKNI